MRDHVLRNTFYIVFVFDLITCAFTKQFRSTTLFTELYMIEYGYFLKIFGGQTLSVLKFSFNVGQFYAENALNNLYS
jgi:hypothetical protein